MQDLFENIQKKSNSFFDEAYQKLNQAQRKAVDHIDGPVMVIAGPGTGKTQILSIRIGNILLQTDTDPKSVLCLTFTEAGASEMRRRLFEFIGPTAFDVNIFTFHAFCNFIIRSNPEAFELFGEFDLVDDLELREILSDILDDLKPGEPLFNYKNQYENLIFNLLEFFNQIKKENWNVNNLINDLKNELKEAKHHEKFKYQRKVGNFVKGDFNEKKYEEFARRINRTIHALQLFDNYNAALFKLQRYDYNDMIQWVLKKFTLDQGFLLNYQERYLYILVDEYQDTNGSQNDILYSLISYDEQPNVFVVGDDDQAIYRFQGAKISNMLEFKKRFDPTIIMLTENYRSTQGILNVAGVSISNNMDRLIHSDPNLSKDLTASGKYRQLEHKPILKQYTSRQAEVTDIGIMIEKLITQGEDPKEIAILFRKNADAEAYVNYFEAKKIPYQVSRKLNVLTEPFIKQIILLLRTIQHEIDHPFQSLPYLFEIFHFPFIAIPLLDIGLLANYRNSLLEKMEEADYTKSQIEFYQCLQNKEILKQLNISDTERIADFAFSFFDLAQAISSHTLQVWFERLLHQFDILNFIVGHEERTFLLQLLHKFFEFLKLESSKDPAITLEKFLHRLNLMEKHKLSLDYQQLIGNKSGVQLSTLHSAKGLEYDHVFMVDQSDKSSKILNRRNFILPETIYQEGESNEDLRRLFYVGLTRAKKNLHLSYATDDHAKKKTVASPFVLEISDPTIINADVPQIKDDNVFEFLLSELRYKKPDFKSLDDPYIDAFIEQYKMNPTGLNKYLECPVQFYYENVLRIPSARTASMGFGKAMHKALELFLKTQDLKKELNIQLLLTYFDKAMIKLKSHFTNKEFESYRSEGHRSLPDFVVKHQTSWKHMEWMRFEQKMETILSNGVPVTGMLDRMDYLGDHLYVIDYKTGSTNSIGKYVKGPDEKNPQGSSYWRQMVFYNLLLDSKKEFLGKRSKYIFYYLIKDAAEKYHEKEIIVSDDHKEMLLNLIQETYNKIRNKVFSPGCGLDTCRWCQYIESGATTNHSGEEEDELGEEEFD